MSGHRLPTSARAEGGALVDQLAQDIQARIAQGELRIGSRLRQESLAHDYGVSRTPIREALRKLQAAGVVVLVRHRGALVQGQTPRQIREAYVVRAEVEGLAARLAAERAGAEDIARLIGAERLFRAAAEEFVALAASAGPEGVIPGGAWDEANDRFHDTVIQAADNHRLSRTIQGLHRTLPRNLTWTALSDEPGLIEENVRQHQGIREAIERRDAAAARRLMIEHVRGAGELVAAWFERRELDGTRT
jgi:DNA-binding GntR family transcriptional regulator